MSKIYSDPLITQLTSQVGAEMERLQIPGLAVGILSGDERYTTGFGFTSLVNPLPVDVDTLFQIGSITKTITALATMRLALCGPDRVIVLDEPSKSGLGEFLCGPQGELVWFRFGGRVHRRSESKK